MREHWRVCYSPAVAKQRKIKPSISIVGPGNLGTALARALTDAGYRVPCIVGRAGSRAVLPAEKLARSVRARRVEAGSQRLETDVVWLTVPDDAIAPVARQLAATQPWQGIVVLHSSGALGADELSALARKGALVASVHPMMTFARGRKPQWKGVAFALEGDDNALRIAKRIVRDLGGEPFLVSRRDKTLYHAFASFASPLVIALMATMEQVAKKAGLPAGHAKLVVAPLLAQTIKNYMSGATAGALTGPLARGDVQTVSKHLAELKRLPEARNVYLALSEAAVELLAVKNRRGLLSALKQRLQQ